MFILIQLLSLLLLFISFSSAANFSPDPTDYNAYGLKIAANNLMMVEAQNDFTEFLIQFAPYTDNITESSKQSCLIEYDDPSQYVYAVALGKNQSMYNIFFVGEMVDLDKSDQLVNRTFIGVLSYTGSNTAIDCENGFISSTQFVQGAFAHQEHLVMTTDPLGLVAYGFSDLFTFSYTTATDTLIVYQNNSLSPSASFLPSAVDYDGSRGIIAGFLSNGRNSRIKYSATAILFSISALTAIATPISVWSFPKNGTAWQVGQTNVGADQYAAKFDMSVSMNPITTQVLIGIQSLNTVFLFNYTTTALTLVTSVDKGQTIGFGKGVAWLSYTLSSFAILANVYSTNYVWSSSKIYVYESALTSTSTPISIFPNIQQPLYNYMSSIFLNIITTPDHLVFLDDQGDLFVILSASSGYYSSTVGPIEEITPAFSSQLPCIPGTYKNVTGIRRCLPCPTGTKNDGTNLTMLTCVNCANNTFCPFGSTSDSISNDLLINVVQAVAYPKSPDVTELDDILFFTLFSLSSSPRCVPLSPIFWTLIVAAVAILIGVGMLVLKYFIKGAKATACYKMSEKVFKQTDVIGEGEWWIGGLATFCVFVLTISCCVISGKYYNSYPIETAGPSTYICDTSVHNAKFTSTLQSLSVPVSKEIQEMVDLLNNQAVNLNVDFLNTVYNCTSDAITLTYLLGTTWLPISTNLSCNSSSYTLSYSTLLPFRQITVRFNLPNIYTIGGLRIGLSALGQVKSSTITLQDLRFSQTFSQSERMLGQDANIALQVTKVINDTSPLTTGMDDVLSGIWIGSFTVNYYESFFADNDYLNAPDSTSTNLTLIIHETPYYILNLQEPIARLPEVVFHNFLFTTMMIELFGLIFLLFKLAILPVLTSLIRKWKPNFGQHNREDSSRRSSFPRSGLEIPTRNVNGQERSECKPNNAVAAAAAAEPSRKPLPTLPITSDGNRIIKHAFEE